LLEVHTELGRFKHALGYRSVKNIDQHDNNYFSNDNEALSLEDFLCHLDEKAERSG